jgi:DNA-binding beta-propeller fold protein YncE
MYSSPSVILTGIDADNLVLAGRRAPEVKNPELLSGSTVLITPDGKRIYAADSKRGGVNVFDATTNRQTSFIDLRPGRPEKMVMASGSGKIYVTDPAAHAVAVIDDKSLTVVDRIPTGRIPKSLALTPDGSRLYIANEDPPQGTISVIDLLPERPVALPAISEVNCPEDLAIAPDGRLLYVASQCGFGEDPVFVVSTATDKVVQRFPGFAVGLNVSVSRNGEKLYVASGSPYRVSALNTITRQAKVVAEIDARFFAATPDGRHLLGVGPARDLIVIDAITDEVLSRRPLGAEAAGIAIGRAAGTSAPVCYVWLQEENSLFSTGLSGILSLN